MRHRRSPATSHPLLLLGAVLLLAGTAVLALLLVRGMTYRGAVAAAAELPSAVRTGIAGISEHGILGLMVMFGIAILHARRQGPPALARGLAAGAGVVLAYLASETIKVLVAELRPCRNFAVETITACPDAADWSWPSNHATISAAIAVAVAVMSARLAFGALPLAGLIALSRVLVGVHYPHDVLAGAVLGALVVLLVTRWGAPMVQRGLEASHRVPLLERTPAGRRPPGDHRGILERAQSARTYTRWRTGLLRSSSSLVPSTSRT
ncbi:phosphatase PAP2 family protein [Brachybacterium sacelli]|uniref:Undecaprenyl-diphosphatase n=1 Tax=Brachybacterium sacelli TaxID=173364 RepID=A0ABS4X2N3_9MICO|nr:phosphatase PAP2 family protein [Brachybacterium sacelli]MBP2382716.1 undecaprenyl-diphosphatase [Brachybacterium sacelli]